MTWLRRNILLLVAVARARLHAHAQPRRGAVLVQRPGGPLQLHVDAVLDRGLGQPLWRPGHLRVAGPVPADRADRLARRDRPRHDDRLRPGPLPLPGPLGDQPADLHADGDPRGRHGLEPADAVPHDGRAGRPHRRHDRAHHVLHLVRRRGRQGPGGDPRPAPGGGGRRPGRQPDPDVPAGHASRWRLPASSPVRCSRSRSASTTTSSPTSTRARARSRSRCTSGAPPSAVHRCRSTSSARSCSSSRCSSSSWARSSRTAAPAPRPDRSPHHREVPRARPHGRSGRRR